MNILQVCAYFYPSYRGTEKTLLGLVGGLTRLGHKVDVLTTNSENVSPQEILEGGVRVFRCRPHWRYLRVIVSLELPSRLWHARDYDLYHVHIPYHYGFESVVAVSRLRGIPLVVTHHGEPFMTNPLLKLASALHGVFYRRALLPAARRIIFFSQSYPDSLSLSPTVRGRIRVIPPAIDATDFTPDRSPDQLRRELGFKEGEKVALCVASLVPWERRKGIHYAIEALARAKREMPGLRLVIVGEGGLVPELRRLAVQSGVEKDTIFVGRKVGSELASYRAMCDVFLVPSCFEPFGLVTLEAQSQGKPVIVSDVPGARETVVPGETGLLVPPRDSEALSRAMLHLLGDPELGRRLGSQARRRVLERTWDQVARENLAVYQEALA